MNNFENQTMNTYEINTRDKQYLPKSKDIEVGQLGYLDSYQISEGNEKLFELDS